MKRFFVLITLMMLLTGASLALAQGGLMPPLAWLGADWNIMTPGGEAYCADGTPYRFLVHPGTSGRLVIYFQGGGMCWDTNTCINLQVYDANTTDETSSMPTAAPESGRGIFNLHNEFNPFLYDTIVYLPYCSGDMHMGASEMDYPTTPGNTVRVQHRGAMNAGAALDWVYENILAPSSVFMAGCSAGGPAAAYHMPFVRQAYPGVPMTVLNDSAGGYEGNLAPLFQSWGTAGILPDWVPGYQGQTPESLDLEQIMIGAATAYPDVRFATFNSRGDTIQAFYLGFMNGNSAGYDAVLNGNLVQMHSAAANLNSFTTNTNTHCVTPRMEFYTLEQNGVRVLDWVNALLAGADPGNVYPPDYPLWFTPPG